MTLILKADDLFNVHTRIGSEVKRTLVGKYTPEGNFNNVNVDSILPIYKGPGICHLLFDFTTEGPRCAYCNGLCLLTKDGNFSSGDLIQVSSGSYKGQEIEVFRTQIDKDFKGKFCEYIAVTPKIKSFVNVISSYLNKIWFKNTGSIISHEYAISMLINYSGLVFTSRVLGLWLCDNINVVKFKPTLGNFRTAVFTKDTFRNTFFQVFGISYNRAFNHGDPNANSFYLSNIPATFSEIKPEIKFNSSIMVDVNQHTSFCFNYMNRLLFYTSKSHVTDIEEPDWGLKITYTNKKNLPRRYTGSPCKKSYLEKRIITFVPTLDMMNYMRKTGINVFPQLYYIILISILLMNRSFYDLYVNNDASRIFSSIFIDDDYIKFMSIVTSNFGNVLSCDQIITFLNKENIRIRDDCFEIVKKDILNFIKTPCSSLPVTVTNKHTNFPPPVSNTSSQVHTFPTKHSSIGPGVVI